MSKLIELAERCEKAAGPDRELDNEIEAAIDFPKPTNPDELPDYPPYFTASLDAAMMLFAEGHFPCIDADPRGIEVEVQYLTDKTDNGLGALVATGGATLPLALCAAALRARASQEVK